MNSRVVGETVQKNLTEKIGHLGVKRHGESDFDRENVKKIDYQVQIIEIYR